MSIFSESRERIIVLGRAEYRYDRLVSAFAEHYIELVRANYETLPDLEILRGWLLHLHRTIRPNLLQAWHSLAEHFGFRLGDRISVDGTELYVIRVSCYPLEQTVHFLGYGVKKDGKPTQSSVTVSLTENTVVQKSDRALEASVIAELYFESSSQQPNVKSFLAAEIAKLP
jgi:hypothetical protein